MNFSTFTFSNDRNNLIIFSLTSYHILEYPSWLPSSGDLDYEVRMKPKQSHRCLIFYNCQKFCILKIILCVKKGPAEWERLSSIMQFLQKLFQFVLPVILEGGNHLNVSQQLIQLTFVLDQYGLVQYFAKVIQTKIVEFRYLFFRNFIELSYESS